MEIINFDQFLEKKNYTNKNSFVPQWPFRLLVIGPSGSGKSNVVCNLIMKDLHFDELYVYARDLEEDKYVYLKDFFHDLEKKIQLKLNNKPPIKIAHFYNSLNDMVNIDKLDGTKQILIVIDDFIQEKDQEKIKEIFLRGRKKNISTVYISQSFFKIPKMIRLNANYVILFDVGNKREIIAISSTFAHRISFNLFQKLYRYVVKQPYGFVFIDMTTNGRELQNHIRNGFDSFFEKSLFFE